MCITLGADAYTFEEELSVLEWASLAALLIVRAPQERNCFAFLIAFLTGISHSVILASTLAIFIS